MVYYWLLKIGWVEVPKMEAKTIDIN